MKKLILAVTLITSLVISTSMAKPMVVDSPIFDAVNCEVYFSPNGGVTGHLVKYIDKAQHKIRLLAYNFTSVDIANALLRAKARGVDVFLVLDKSVPTEKNSALGLLYPTIPVLIDHTHAISHNKVILVDDTYFETGSFNYSDNAEKKNGENALMCKSVQGTFLYNANWELHKSHSVAP